MTDKELILVVKGVNSKFIDYLADKKKLEETQKSVTEEEIKVKKKKILEEVSRDINICQVGIKEAEKAVNEASCVLQQLCQDFKEFEKKGRFVSRT